MIVYRITNEKYKGDLSGTGSYLYGGRWNYADFYMLYAAEHISLALVEILVHSNYRNGNFLLQTIELPTNQEYYRNINSQKFPIDWNQNIEYTQEIGTDFLKNADLLYMTVPSVIIPEEKNILINPKNSLFKKVKLITEKPFDIDKRLIK